MGDKQHRYGVRVTWTGNVSGGTLAYRGYERAHEISGDGKPMIAGSSDPSFRPDPTRWNPEEFLVASLSACHKLWYLALCVQAGVIVTAYEDNAQGLMAEDATGSGQFTSVNLRPHVMISAGSDAGQASTLHRNAHAMRFIARSVNFPVTIAPTIVREDVQFG